MKSLKVVFTAAVSAYITIGALHFAGSQVESDQVSKSTRAPASLEGPVTCQFETPSAIKAVGKGASEDQALMAAANDCYEKGQNKWISTNRIPIDIGAQEQIVLECANSSKCG